MGSTVTFVIMLVCDGQILDTHRCENIEVKGPFPGLQPWRDKLNECWRRTPWSQKDPATDTPQEREERNAVWTQCEREASQAVPTPPNPHP